MALWQHYHQPETVEAALLLLAHYDGQARVVAGGTDLLLEMQQNRKPPVAALVDVTAISELGHIELADDWLVVGASATHSQIVKNAAIRHHAACLVESCGLIGGPQVRNVATLGGNVAHALPAADGTTALVALDAEAEVANPAGRSWRPLLTLFRGVGQSAIDTSREIITRFRCPPLLPGQGTAFKRIMRPQGVALPILACAAWIQLGPDDADGDTPPEARMIEAARICVGPLAPVPCRIAPAEAALAGGTLRERLELAISQAQASFAPRASKHRSSAAYRREMMAVLLRRCLPLAVRRAATGEAVPEGVGLEY
jgi:carbon-monoxide dehydrogenase medium subunit